MKIKKVSVICLIIFSITAMSLTSFSIPYSDATYHTCEEIQANIEENVDNYFLPAAYDISPFTVSYGEYLHEANFECEDFYKNKVVRDERGKITVPPIYSLIVGENLYDNYRPQFFAAYVLHNLNNKNSVEMTPSMWRVLHTDKEDFYNSPEKSASLQSVINAYLAPWTLNNGDKLYTWNEIMAMNEQQLMSLNFNSYEFAHFISDVKQELESRGWWKEEYQQKYDVLASHKDDYRNLQSENEIISVDGCDIYLSRIDDEYKSDGKMSLSSIISANIYIEEFARKVENLDDSVKQKYSLLIDAINKEYSTNIKDVYVDFYKDNYHSFLSGAYVCETELSVLSNFFDGSDEYKQYNGMYAFRKIKQSKLSDQEIKKLFSEYNYIASDGGAFNFEMIDTIIESSEQENINYFTFPTSVVFSYQTLDIHPWWRVATIDWTNGDFDEELDRIDNYDRVIEKLEYLYDNVDSGNYKQNFRNNIDYLKQYSEGITSPQTGENTFFYLIISASALACMTALLVKRKRERA